MRIISRAPCALGMAIALSVGAAGFVGAQATDTTYKGTVKVTKKKIVKTRTTSSRRIPVTKQVTQVAPVQTVRIDTVIVTQTVASKPDTVFMPAPPARVETVTVIKTVSAGTVAPVLVPKKIGNWYWGLGGGASLPQGTLNNGYGTGYNITMPFGWDAATNPLGLRFDLGYDREMGKASAGIQNDVGVWSGNADLKLRMPIPGVHNSSRFYVVGGGGVARVVGYGSSTPVDMNGYSNSPNLSSSFSNAKTEYSWNAGAGFTFPVAKSKLFIESRYIDVNSSSSLGSRTQFVPVILGIIF